MNKATKELLRKNNIMEEQMSKESNKIYTDMVVYLRGSDITEYNQEMVRQDIIQMIIEGEKRGDDISKTIGSNYKEICDEIILVFPKKTVKEKAMDVIQMTLMCIWILCVISIIQNVMINLIRKQDLLQFSLSIGDVINAIVIIVLANVVVNLICKNAFSKPVIQNKILLFLVNWVICMIVFGGFMLISKLFKNEVINTNLIWIVIVAGILCIADKMVSSKG